MRYGYVYTPSYAFRVVQNLCRHADSVHLRDEHIARNEETCVRSVQTLGVDNEQSTEQLNSSMISTQVHEEARETNKRGACVTHKSGRGFRCELCDKQLSSAQTLRTHMLTHRGERPWKCPVSRQVSVNFIFSYLIFGSTHSFILSKFHFIWNCNRLKRRGVLELGRTLFLTQILKI